MPETVRERVIRVVAQYHGLAPDQVTDRFYLKPEFIRPILDELCGTNCGSSSRVAVASIIALLEMEERDERQKK